MDDHSDKDADVTPDAKTEALTEADDWRTVLVLVFGGPLTFGLLWLAHHTGTVVP
jgi:hypothetical protein